MMALTVLLGDYSDDDSSAPCTVDSTGDDKQDSTTISKDEQPSTLSAAPLVDIELPVVNSAPSVETFGALTLHHKSTGGAIGGGLRAPEAKTIANNPKADVLYKPVLGPLRPHEQKSGHAGLYQNHPSGHVEAFCVGHSAFTEQYLSYRTTGVAIDPSDWHAYSKQHTTAANNGVQYSGLTSATVSLANAGTSIDQLKAAKQQQWTTRTGATNTAGIGLNPNSSSDDAGGVVPTSVSKRVKKSRNVNWDPSADTYKGPWAPFEIDEFTGGSTTGPAAGDDSTIAAESPTDAEPSSGTTGVNTNKDTSSGGTTEEPSEAVTSIFHGKQETDYQGRSWMSTPPGVKLVDPDEIEAQLPRKLLHTYVGHTMGVHAIRFFPGSGHLLLSGSMDSSIKIWDLYNQRKCLRTYMGHTQAVRDIQFTNDGKRFFSCSYDKNICLWDTEYGKIIGKFTNGKIPYCVSVHPETGKQDDFIIGSSNKRAVEFDATSGKIVQEYSEHLGAVNTVTFCDDGRKLVTTSDDKKVFIWEHGIPVVVKHISEPHMHAMPAVRKHPSNKYIACQSMDNKIVVYEALGRFRFQGRKIFKGHLNAGYAIMPGFSPDGRFIMSGDAGGKLWFWDWKNLKNYRTIQAHSGVCICADWHPFMKSRVATCGWDGVIKLWD